MAHHKLHPNHTWRAKEGHRIVVLDRGAVRFDIPEQWVVIPSEKLLTIYDKQPPADDCRLEVSIFKTPLVNWNELPLSALLMSVLNSEQRTPDQEVHKRKLGDKELAWTELAFVDRQEHRAARSRICLARGSGVHSLLTLDFWASDVEPVSRVWDEILESLQLERYVEDPTRGPQVH